MNDSKYILLPVLHNTDETKAIETSGKEPEIEDYAVFDSWFQISKIDGVLPFTKTVNGEKISLPDVCNILVRCDQYSVKMSMQKVIQEIITS